MKHKLTILALFGAVTFFSGLGTAFANIEVTHYQGSREALRAMCLKQHGDLIETQSKTRCNTVTGITYICKDSGACVKQDYVTTAFDPTVNGGSLSSGHETIVKKAPPKKEEK